jgi:hypothetical protein
MVGSSPISTCALPLRYDPLSRCVQTHHAPSHLGSGAFARASWPGGARTLCDLIAAKIETGKSLGHRQAVLARNVEWHFMACFDVRKVE